MAGPVAVIVGAGSAGTRAAVRLVEAGLRPVVVDEAPASGGQIYRRPPPGFRRPAAALYGTEAEKAEALHADFDRLRDRIDYRPETLAWTVWERHLHLVRDGRESAIRFDALILAPGATDRVMPLPGWTLPGVFTLGGAQVALKAQGCAIGHRVAFLGTGPLLTLVAAQYAKVGADVVAVLDTAHFGRRVAALADLRARPGFLLNGIRMTARLAARRVPLHFGVTPLRIEGDGAVGGIAFRNAAGRERLVDCDAVGLGYGPRSETQLADLARCRFAFDPTARQFLPETDADGRSTMPDIYLAGDGARVLGADAAELAGRLAACAAIQDLGLGDTEAEREGLRARLAPMARFRRGLETAFPWPAHLAAALPDDTMVCRCEAVTAGEIREAARAKGAPEVNRAKAFSRVGMGRCQGRMCGPAAAEILAAALGVPVEQVGRLRGQAPVKPLPLSLEPESPEPAE